MKSKDGRFGAAASDVTKPTSCLGLSSDGVIDSSRFSLRTTITQVVHTTAHLVNYFTMTFSRSLFMLRSSALRRVTLSAVPRGRLQVRFATSDYGSGDGNPVGEKPQQQGQNASENLEHPGPAPPKVAHGKSSSSPNSDQGGSNSSPKSDPGTSNAKTDSPSGKRKFSTSAQQNASKEPAVEQAKQNQPSRNQVRGAKPKILNESPPNIENQSEEVKKHNEEVAQRAEKPAGQVRNEDIEKDKIAGGGAKGGRSKSGSANEVIGEATKQM